MCINICGLSIKVEVVVDQFAYYARTTESDCIWISLDEDDPNIGPYGRLRLYGEGPADNVELVGISYNATGDWDSLDQSDHIVGLEILTKIAEEAGVPGIWIGETDDEFTSSSQNKEIGPITKNGGIECSPTMVPVGDLAQGIRDEFNSDASPPSNAQPFNTEPVDGFQEWAQGALGLTTIDLDVVGLTQSGDIHSLTEIKRSKVYDIPEWYPHTLGEKNDMPNFSLQIDAAHRTGARPLVINHPVNGYVNADDTVYLYNLEGDDMNIVRKLGTRDTFTDDRCRYNRTRTNGEEALSVVIGDQDWP